VRGVCRDAPAGEPLASRKSTARRRFTSTRSPSYNWTPGRAGRVTLVGDAGYCPGPAVGGSTSIAVLGAYVLAGELARANGDYARAFAAYERRMGEPVRRSRAFARAAAKTIVPDSRAGVWALTRAGQLISALPSGPHRTIAKWNTRGARLHDSMPVPDYAGADVWQHRA